MNASAFILLILFLAASSGSLAQESDGAISQSAVAFTVRSVTAGRQLYAGLCASCHGANGVGDTSYREFLKTPPADLTDDEWVHGSSGAAMFDVIKHGRTETDMPAFGEQTTDERIWYLIHYVQYLGGRRP